MSYGSTESGDDLPLLSWGATKPTDDRVNAAYEERLPGEFDEVGFVNWKLDTAEVVR